MPSWARFVAIAIGVAISIWLGVRGAAADPTHTEEQLRWFKPIPVLWAVAPPFWFAAESSLYKGLLQGEKFDRFKLYQDRAKDIWLGVVAALVIWFGFK